MKEQRLEFGVVSANEREDLYAELLCNDQQWGEISIDTESKRPRLVIYPSRTGEILAFDLVELQRLLEDAATRLAEVEGGPMGVG